MSEPYQPVNFQTMSHYLSLLNTLVGANELYLKTFKIVTEARKWDKNRYTSLDLEASALHEVELAKKIIVLENKSTNKDSAVTTSYTLIDGLTAMIGDLVTWSSMNELEYRNLILTIGANKKRIAFTNDMYHFDKGNKNFLNSEVKSFPNMEDSETKAMFYKPWIISIYLLEILPYYIAHK